MSLDPHIHEQLKFAKRGARNLAKRNGYKWTRWLAGPQGQSTASFEREGELWSLSFCWTPRESLGALADRIEKMDHYMQTAMKEFNALRLGALVRDQMQGGVH